MTNELQSFDQLKAEVTIFVEPCMTLTVTTPQECEMALVALKDVKRITNKIEDRRKELTKPLVDLQKKYNSYAKEISEPLDKAEAHIKSGLRKWELKLEQERIEAFKKAEEERKKAEAEALAKLEAQKEEAEAMSMFMDAKESKKAEIVAMAEADRTVVEIEQRQKEAQKEIMSHKVTGARKVWTFEITGENEIPRAFLSIDEKKIRAAIKDGVRDIPGVRIYQETTIAAV